MRRSSSVFLYCIAPSSLKKMMMDSTILIFCELLVLSGLFHTVDRGSSSWQHYIILLLSGIVRDALFVIPSGVFFFSLKIPTGCISSVCFHESVDHLSASISFYIFFYRLSSWHGVMLCQWQTAAAMRQKGFDWILVETPSFLKWSRSWAEEK